MQEKHSVFDVHLDFTLEVVVVFVSFLKLEVYQGSKVAVEAEQLFLASLVGFKLPLEGDGVAAAHDVARAAIDASTIKIGDERLDADAEAVINNSLMEVLSATVTALVLVFFDINQDVLRQAYMHKGV